MERETVLTLVHVVTKLLTALRDVELFGTNQAIIDVRNGMHDAEQAVARVALDAAELLDVPPIPVPEHYAVPLLGDGVPVAPAIGAAPANYPTPDERFYLTWIGMAEDGKCDEWGGSEQIRVYHEWVVANRPKGLVQFITQHANRPAANQ